MSESALQIAASVSQGAVTATSVAEAALDAVVRIDPAINAFTAVLRERALAEAQEVDRRIASRETLPLAGVP